MPTDPSLLGTAGEPCWMDVKTRDVAKTGSLLETGAGVGVILVGRELLTS